MSKSDEDLMIGWGLPNHYLRSLWKPSETVEKFLTNWIEKFPDNNIPGILVLSNGSIHPFVFIVRLMNTLLEKRKIKTRIHIIDLPRLMIRLVGTIEEKVELLNNAQRAIQSNDDLVIFEDLGITKMSSENINLAHSLINPMVKRSKPFIVSSSASSDEFGQNVGSGLYRLINGSAQVIRI